MLAQVTTLVAFIREMPSSNFGPDTNYSEGCFVVFLSPPIKCIILPKIVIQSINPFLAHSFHFIIR
jgi:hypothetical protein